MRCCAGKGTPPSGHEKTRAGNLARVRHFIGPSDAFIGK
jgi:hypothetical protein